jgi:hypothetical protein
MEKEFGSRMVLNSQELDIKDDTSFILLLLAAMKSGEKKTFYDVEFLEGYIENNGYKYPNMRFIRRDKENNDNLWIEEFEKLSISEQNMFRKCVNNILLQKTFIISAKHMMIPTGMMKYNPEYRFYRP